MTIGARWPFVAILLYVLFFAGFVTECVAMLIRGRLSRDISVLLAVLAGACAIGTRLALGGFGYVYGGGLLRAFDVLLAVTLLLLVVTVLGGSGTLGSASTDQRLNFVTGLLALPVAALAVVGIVVPASGHQADSPVCDGAAVAGSKLTARTGYAGLNARSGPGTTYPAQGKFDVGCLVGIDGYCVGEGVQDSVVPLPDVRWFRLRHTNRYVSAGAVFPLGPDIALGSAPERACPGGQTDPVLATDPSLSKESKDVLVISARPVRTNMVGFAVRYDKQGFNQIQPLGVAPKITADDGLAYGRVSISANTKPAGSSHQITVAVVPCLASISPSHVGAKLLRIDLRSGRTVALPNMFREDPHQLSDAAKDAAKEARQRLAVAACRIDPSAGNSELSSKSKSVPVRSPQSRS